MVVVSKDIADAGDCSPSYGRMSRRTEEGPQNRLQMAKHNRLGRTVQVWV
jgi:hypothetical protein